MIDIFKFFNPIYPFENGDSGPTPPTPTTEVTIVGIPCKADTGLITYKTTKAFSPGSLVGYSTEGKGQAYLPAIISCRQDLNPLALPKN